MKRNSVQKMVLSSLFLALGLIMPFLTGQIQQFGNMLLPMHIPVLLCGFVCGPWWGLAVGFITPLLRSVLFSMPPLFPIATVMAFELLTYGLVAGFLYSKLSGKRSGTFVALVGAMLAGRVVWGIAANFFYQMAGMPFGWQIFLAGGLLNAWPGILLQFLVIPPIVLALQKKGYISE
ncbi:MAG: ECF transporter S component [Clostridia bacterium]|nr:ECF transporter S component [Clostridia bacterium]